MKLKPAFSVLVLILSTHFLYSQTVTGIVPKKDKFHPYLSVGVGASWSVIDNRMEIRDALKPGISYKLAIHTKPWFYWSAEYTKFKIHEAHPAITGIHSWNSELNGNMLFNFGRSDLKFKTNFGVGMMDWYGTYIGPSWNDNKNYYIGMQLTDHWIYGTLGCGVEHEIGRYFSASADFRMRFASKNKEMVSICDTGFFIGASYNLRKTLPPAARNSTSAHSKNNNKKKSRIYKWLKTR